MYSKSYYYLSEKSETKPCSVFKQCHTVAAPTTVKKFATGKGNADKTMMHKSFMDDVGIDLKEEITPDKGTVDNPVSDIVDSYLICKYLHDKVLQSYTF